MAPLPGEWEVLRPVIDLIQANAKGAELGPVLETIERALRADRPGQDDRGGVSGTAGRSRTGPAAPCRPRRPSAATDFNQRGNAAVVARVIAWGRRGGLLDDPSRTLAPRSSEVGDIPRPARAYPAAWRSMWVWIGNGSSAATPSRSISFFGADIAILSRSDTLPRLAASTGAILDGGFASRSVLNSASGISHAYKRPCRLEEP